jgi:putative Mn2+ efflux pump MntP
MRRGNGLISCGIPPDMKKITLLICITIFSWLGWWLGGRFGMMTGYLTSFIGSLLGVYVGVKINREYLD